MEMDSCYIIILFLIMHKGYFINFTAFLLLCICFHDYYLHPRNISGPRTLKLVHDLNQVEILSWPLAGLAVIHKLKGIRLKEAIVG